MIAPNIATIDFRQAIVTAAVEAGRAPTAEQVADLDAYAKAHGYLDFGKGAVISVNGSAETFAAWLASELPKLPAATPQIDPADIPPARSSEPLWTRGRDDVFARMVRASCHAHDEALAREAETWPNPFLKNNWNLTRQTIMKNKNPALWAKAKSEAGV